MTIQVIDVRILPGTKATRAFADVRLGDITIYDFRILQTNGRPHVRAPFCTYKNQTGELCFRQIVDLPDDVRGQVDTMILSAFYREKENSNERHSQ